MILFVQIISVIMMLLGSIFIIYPKNSECIINFWIKDKRIYWGAVLTVIIGLSLIMAAKNCKISLIIYLYGALSLLKGFLLIFISKCKVKQIMLWFCERPDNFKRLIGVIAILNGLLLFYAA